jgi:hypothetical protein
MQLEVQEYVKLIIEKEDIVLMKNVYIRIDVVDFV